MCKGNIKKAFELCDGIRDRSFSHKFIFPITLLDRLMDDVDEDEALILQWSIDRLMEMLFKRAEEKT